MTHPGSDNTGGTVNIYQEVKVILTVYSAFN